jgi:hypothetical protein
MISFKEFQQFQQDREAYNKCMEVLEFNEYNDLPMYENQFRPESKMFSIWWEFLRTNLNE